VRRRRREKTGQEKEVTARFTSVIKFSLGGKFPEHFDEQKNPNSIGAGGRWLIFAGIPTNVTALFFMITDSFFPRLISPNVEPYTNAFIPLTIVIGSMVLYDHFPKQLVIPLGIAGWIAGLSLLYWYFWFGSGAFGHVHEFAK
jgi:hypothetical protein